MKAADDTSLMSSDEMQDGYTPMLDREQVLAFAEANGLIATEVHGFLADGEGFALLGDSTPEDMADFVRSHGITSMFYEYTYVDESDFYVVPPDLESEDDQEFEEALEAKVDAWNDRVYDTDFTEPGYLYLFAIYQGRVFGIETVNPDYAEFLDIDPFDRYIDLFIEASDEVPQKEE